MLAVFRTDASGQIGTGHVVRCSTLADALRQSGFECLFVCRTLTADLAESLRVRGHSLHMLPSAPAEGVPAPEHHHPQPHHAHWLGADWKTDAAQTLAVIADRDPDWLIVDHYAIDERWESTLRAAGCRRLMVIDDLADRRHDCDLLLDQNLIAGWARRYDDKVADDCELLLGPAYALLQPIYAELRRRVPPREGPVRRILVYFGGADAENLTGKAVSALVSLGRSDVHVDVVINPAHDHAAAIRTAVDAHSFIVLHEGLPSLAPLMVSADLAIGASGTNSWERCCLGLPTLVVTLAENQKPIAAELDRLGLIRLLGHKDKIEAADLAREIGAVLGGHPFARVDGQIDVDGEGVRRVVAALLAREPLMAELATVEDERLLRKWRRADQSAADKDLRRFREGLRDLDGCCIFSVETADGFPVGQVRFDKADAGWTIDCAFAPLARRFTMESAVLTTAIASHRKIAKGALSFLPARFGLRRSGETQISSASSLKIAICSDAGSWINETAAELVTGWLAERHSVSWVHAADDLPGGDLCFYLSYGRIVGEATRSRYRHNLIVHASDLPKGRGWSPASWLILGGADQIPVTLFEAVDAVDAGPIYLQDSINLDGAELIEDWRPLIAQTTSDLANAFVAGYPSVLDKAREQVGEPTMYPRRRAQDSLLDSEQSIAAQFNQLRIVDNDSYPAFFRHNGKEFILKILPR